MQSMAWGIVSLAVACGVPSGGGLTADEKDPFRTTPGDEPIVGGGSDIGAAACEIDYGSAGIATAFEVDTSLPVINGCGVITESGRLAADLWITNTNQGVCLDVQGNDIVIQGAGHAIQMGDWTNNAIAVQVRGSSWVTLEGIATDGPVAVESSSLVSVLSSELGTLTYSYSASALVANSVIGALRFYGSPGAIVAANDLPSGVSLRAAQAGNTLEYPSYAWIEGNDIGGTVSLSNASYSTIACNTIESDGVVSGVEIDGGNANLVENNTIDVDLPNQTMTRGALWLSNNYATTVRGNLLSIRSITGVATVDATSSRGRNKLEENVIVGDGAAVAKFSLLDNDTVRHNTFYNTAANRSGVLFDPLQQGSGGLTFKDNIVSMESGVALGFTTGFTGAYTASLASSDYNVFDGRTSAPIFADSNNYFDLAQWTLATNLDPHSVVGDPAFVDAEALDFHLGEGSAAWDRASDGTDAGAFPND